MDKQVKQDVSSTNLLCFQVSSGLNCVVVVRFEVRLLVTS